MRKRERKRSRDVNEITSHYIHQNLKVDCLRGLAYYKKERERQREGRAAKVTLRKPLRSGVITARYSQTEKVQPKRER